MPKSSGASYKSGVKQRLSIGLLLLTVAIGVGAIFVPELLWGFVLLGPVLLLCAYDLLQKRHTILRNYPVVGHLRYMLEDARHHIRQYLIQGDKEGDPFTRPQRSVVYQRAKGVSDVQPFGTLEDVYQEGYEFIEHSILPAEVSGDPPRVWLGGEHCEAPYSASLLNISAMSFGSLSKNALLALNGGARKGGFYHNTGEGGLSRYHLEPGGDVVWELGTGYFGACSEPGVFAAELFAEKSQTPAVKMIELKLSQGAKPGGGGILPAAKVTQDIAEARGVPIGKDVLSPARHSTFNTPLELVAFIAELRRLSGGKPVGFKLCVGRTHEFMAVVKAMLATGITPDFITIDGKEGGTGAAPLEMSNRVGLPLREGLIFAHNALVGAGLRDKIRVIASGKIINAYDILRTLAMGADVCNSARGMMFALGCIQARRCHANTCPTGVATQDPWRMNGLVVSDKEERVYNYHKNTLKHLQKLLAACGLSDPSELGPEMLLRRVTPTTTSSYSEIFSYLEPGQLTESESLEPWYASAWQQARADSFSRA
ncbi:MAG: FMN-binding glutamate synthase family protein [Gammaproteobacteria bacterium]|nr:FMN-binding glutamate synthase family protein [Gammaproteobacteria bacterium]